MKTPIILTILVSLIVAFAHFTPQANGYTNQIIDLHQIQRWTDRADSLWSVREPDSAVVVAKMALETIELLCPECDSLRAHVLSQLGNFYNRRGSYPKAVEYFQQSVQIMEKESWPDKLLLAEAHRRFGVAYRVLGQMAEAELHQRRALEVLKIASKDGIETQVKCLRELGIVYHLQLRYAEADSLASQACNLCAAWLGRETTSYARLMNWIGYMRKDQGRYDEAETYFKRALEIRKKLHHPQQHQSFAESYNNLGEVYEEQGRLAEAESCYVLALRIRERRYWPEHPFLVYPLINLGELCALQSRYVEADSFFRRGLKIVETEYGPNHLQAAWSINGLADMYRWQGKYAQAESLYYRALIIREDAFGPDHPKVVETLGGLARLHASVKEYSKSLADYDRLLASKRSFLQSAFSYASESQKMAYARLYSLCDHTLLSLCGIYNSRFVRCLALEMILKAKAAVIDALVSEKELAFCSNDENMHSTQKRLMEVYGEISTMSLVSAASQEVSGEFRDRLRFLNGVKDSLEADLSRDCSEFRDRLTTREFGVADVAQAMPEGSVLWEFMRYRPFDFYGWGEDSKRTGPPRYLAFILDHQGNVGVKDLGDAREIDSLIASIRNRIDKDRALVYSHAVGQSEEALKSLTGRLYDVVFAPLEASSNGKKDIFISPDGQLNLLPFEILPCPDDKYVMEKFKISYLSSGRDLLKFQGRSSPSDCALVIADPDFQSSLLNIVPPEPAIPQISHVFTTGHEPARGVGGCLDVPFNNLPQTRREGESICQTLRERAGLAVSAYYGAQAQEDVLKNIDVPPRVLHVASHANFCEDIDPAQNKTLQNPLLRCGLVLAGANLLIREEDEIPGQSEDGILTALEASGLNLVGTELVTLSACETGLGEVRNGEGVYGLRRAFQHAGARTIVMSLWKVPDLETRRLMTRFYQSWLDGQSKKEALRNAALTIIRDSRNGNGSAHPLLWGGFIMLGDPY